MKMKFGYQKYKLFLAIILPLFLSSCIANKEISTRACEDPKYLHLLAVPIDSMSARDFAYFQMKDRECEEATAAANAVVQEQTGQQHTTVLVATLEVVGAVLTVLLATKTIR